MTEMFGEAWSPMSVPDLAPDDDDDGFKHEPTPTPFFLSLIDTRQTQWAERQDC